MMIHATTAEHEKYIIYELKTTNISIKELYIQMTI